jgi:signal transduction histidine kinase
MRPGDGQRSNVWRFTPLLAVVAAAALLVGAAIMALYLDRSYREQKTAEVSVQAAILASTITAALSFGDSSTGQEYVNALAVNPEIEAAAVYDASGKIFVTYVRTQGGFIPELAPASGANFVGEKLIVVAPVEQAGTTLGKVYLRAVTEPVARRIERYALFAALVFMASLLVAVLGFAQRALGRANTELEARGHELATANAELVEQIAQREAAEGALRQAQKMEAIGQLTGGIAHDFNNLLQIILGSLDRLSSRLGDPSAGTDPRVPRLIDAAIRGAERAAALTRRLLAFSRRQTLTPVPVDVNRLVGGMSDLLPRTLGPEISVQIVLDTAAWQVFVDENQLENALLNLAVNARDAMPNGGSLIIATSNIHARDSETPGDEVIQGEIVTGDHTQIAVTDTGAGMSKEVLAKAFDPFYTTKDIGQGTGLGLSQVYGFVSQSGGHVRVISQPGHGTSVRLCLPRLLESVSVTHQKSEPAPQLMKPRGNSTETILVVEDEPDVRMATVETLRGLGYEVIEAPDGHVALRQLADVTGIRLLFTDVGLPGGMNGVQLAEAARRRDPGLLVLFTTGYARDAFAVHSPLTAGAEVLSKPFDELSLARKLRDVLDGVR